MVQKNNFCDTHLRMCNYEFVLIVILSRKIIIVKLEWKKYVCLLRLLN
jgi:hypothetical protein